MEHRLLVAKEPLFWTFGGGGKYGLFWAKKLMEIWYLLITKKFLLWTFREWKIRSLFETKFSEKLLVIDLFWIFRGWKIRHFLNQKVNGKMIFTGYWKVLVLSFSVMRNTVFFEAKSWYKGNIYLVFLSFPWYSRTWEIRFFV